MFSQILPLVFKADFQDSIKGRKAERHARGFSSWDQCVAMLFCHLQGAKSLREVCYGLASCEGRLLHLGLDSAPSRSTLAYANSHRPWQAYQDVFLATYNRWRHTASVAGGGHRLRFKNKLMSLDASIIDLCIEMYDWAKFRRTKGAVKLHMLLDHDGYLPAYAVVTTGSVHEIKVARTLRFEPDTVVVFDRGYTDYEWFGQLCRDKVWFVTRLKSNAVYDVVESRDLPEGRLVMADEIIRLRGASAQACDQLLRRVEVLDPDKGEPLVFLTNNLRFGSTTIAAIYKERWQIELFFKAIKQNLKIKTFLGTTANAVHTQIWTALLAMLLLKIMQLRAKFGWSLSNLVALLRMNLFVYRDLWAWLDNPDSTPPDVPPEVPSEQYTMAFA
jgi:hypothetical protein